MSKANSRLGEMMRVRNPQENLVNAIAIPKPNGVNQQGLPAYKQEKWLRLLTMLNTVKMQDQYYRGTDKALSELQSLITDCAKENPYLTCQCIVYSRCLGEGMRSINHAAAVFIAPHISGQEYSKRFYGLWNKKEEKGGVIYRPDDMYEILHGFIAVNEGRPTGVKLSNAMKKGFKDALETLDTYSLLKYKSKLFDVINLAHPSGARSGAVVEHEGKEVFTLDAIMRGYNVSANTWEVNQGKAGQIVAKAVKEGKISETEAKEILKEAKAENWKELLLDGNLGILACIRNLRNILKSSPDTETIDAVVKLVSDPKLIKKGKIMPYQIDIANEIMLSEFSTSDSRRISSALALGYELAIPNLATLLPGRNVIFLDMSGSMETPAIMELNKSRQRIRSSCAFKASLIAATIAKATNADIIVFGSTAHYVNYNPNLDVFSLAAELNNPNLGGTNLSLAWQAAMLSGNQYERVFILSDNEVNDGSTYDAYAKYVRKTGNPYIYSVDLAGYGSNCIAGERVRYYFGYGFAMFDDITNSEFNASHHLDKVSKVVI